MLGPHAADPTLVNPAVGPAPHSASPAGVTSAIPGQTLSQSPNIHIYLSITSHKGHLQGHTPGAVPATPEGKRCSYHSSSAQGTGRATWEVPWPGCAHNCLFPATVSHQLWRSPLPWFSWTSPAPTSHQVLAIRAPLVTACHLL